MSSKTNLTFACSALFSEAAINFIPLGIYQARVLVQCFQQTLQYHLGHKVDLFLQIMKPLTHGVLQYNDFTKVNKCPSSAINNLA